ncbi:MAG: hypothetical protein LBK02_06860 [Treponema sp.]|jgi:hypothetical protein|nr:hypothetical protein [Treponema sp.]
MCGKTANRKNGFNKTAINIDESGATQSANFSFMNRRPNALPGNMGDQDNYLGTLLNGMRLENTAMPSNPYTAGTYIVDINRIQSPAIVTSMPDPANAIDNTNNRVSVYTAYYDRTARQVRFRAGTAGKDFTAASGSDISGIASNTGLITANGHGLTTGTQVYLRSNNANINVDKTVPYYVRDANTNTFNVASTLGGNAVDISNSGFATNTPVVISVTGGGLADLSGYVNYSDNNTNSRINHTDAKTSSYQTVTASGEYNPGTTIPYATYANVPAFNVTYPQATTYGPGPHVAIGAAALRVKVAYRDYAQVPGALTVAGVDGEDRFTGAWEVSTVPTTKAPTDYRISVGVHTVAGTLTAIPGGTKVTGAIYGTVPVDPPTRVYGNNTSNPVVGYGTSTILEMAQKK